MTVNDRIFFTLQQKRKQNNVTQYLEIKHEAVSNWKTRKSVPNIENLEKIATFLNISLDFLITGKEHNTTIHSNENHVFSQKMKKHSHPLQFMNSVKCLQNRLVF